MDIQEHMLSRRKIETDFLNLVVGQPSIYHVLDSKNILKTIHDIVDDIGKHALDDGKF